MPYYLYEGELRNDEYRGDSVMAVLESIASRWQPGEVQRRFAGDVIVYDEASWQDLLMCEDGEEDDPVEYYVGSLGLPRHLSADERLLYVSAFPLGECQGVRAAEAHVVVSATPDAQDIEVVFDRVLPDYGYRIRRDSN